MDKIVVDFGNIVEEMKRKKIRLCLLNNRIGWFAISDQNQLYQIETYYCGGFLDKYIIEKRKIKFNIVPISVSNNIEEWEKDIWDVEDVEKFIERQHLNE